MKYKKKNIEYLNLEVEGIEMGKDEKVVYFYVHSFFSSVFFFPGANKKWRRKMGLND